MDKPKRIYRMRLTLVRLWAWLCTAGALVVAGCAAVTGGDAQAIVDLYLALEPDVMIGGGRDFFLPKGPPGGKRADGRDMVAAFAQKGYRIARTPEEMMAADARRLLALFADEDMDFELDRDAAKEPSTADIARAALGVLARAN